MSKNAPQFSVVQETLWLARHPEFWQRPATMTEFLGEGYLDIYSGVRTGVRELLCDIFDSDQGVDGHGNRIARVERALFTGGIGTGKTTMASIALLYMVHWVLCLKDPQGYYNLLPGSRIAFMMMSTSEQQAREVVFGDIMARMKNSPWFESNAEYDPKFTKQIRFPGKDIWILPGDSRETTFEGYNILGGILDESDSHKKTKEKDYAEDGYDTIINRIKSRYVDNSDPNREGHKGLIIVIGQMKRRGGFVAKKYEEFKKDKYSLAHRMSVWESFGWDKYTLPNGKRNSFWYDTKRKVILPEGTSSFLASDSAPENLIEVPKQYLHEFKNKPEKALKDLAGIPPHISDPFIGMIHKISEAQDRYEESNPQHPGGIITESCVEPKFIDNVTASRTSKYTAHIDLAYSSDGDAAAIALGHVPWLVETEDGDLSPYIMIDALIRVRARPGQEIILRDIRQYVYDLRELGFRIHKVTLDGFQSVDTMQQLRRRRIGVDYLSVDRSKEPYESLRDALYESRIEFPRYMTYKNPGDTEARDVLMQELLELTDTGPKIDHPVNGSKDLADALAAVTYSLMNDNTYRKGVPSNRRRPESSMSSSKLDELFGEFSRSSMGGPGGAHGLPVPSATRTSDLGLPPRMNPSSGINVPPRFLG